MFDSLKAIPADPILGVTAAFRRDVTVLKVDLGVGVYRDERGNTPIPASVEQAERELLAEQTTKTYLSPLGNEKFNARMTDLVLGAALPGLTERISTAQSPGGSGALRLGAQLIMLANPASTAFVSDPTWANHMPLLGGTGITLAKYPYYSPATHDVEVERMLASLDTLAPDSVVVLHACCHNPTGADLDSAAWARIAEIVERRGLLPFVDLAYQGMGEDLERDAAPIRLLAARVPQMLVAVSCSKNFGLYRERTGLLITLAESASQAAIVSSQLARIARTLYSMPPDHGAAIVERVLASPVLRAQWVTELAAITARITSLRRLLATTLGAQTPRRDYAWIARQRGMFSLLDLTPDKVTLLREQHHVYLTPDGRINVAGISPDNVGHVAAAIAALS